MSTRSATPRTPGSIVLQPLLSPGSSSGSLTPAQQRARARRREESMGAASLLFPCTPALLVSALSCLWFLWLCSLLLLSSRPSLLSPLAGRHAALVADRQAKHEHDGPGHRHEMPGMVVRPHGVHSHGGDGEQHPAVALAAVPAAVAAAAGGQVSQAAAAVQALSAAADQARVTQPPVTARPAASLSPGVVPAPTPISLPVSSPPESSSTPRGAPPRGAASVAPGTRRRTPRGGVGTSPDAAPSSCPDASGGGGGGGGGAGGEHDWLDQFALPPNGATERPGSADDYESDEAPLRQLDVRSVNLRRPRYSWGPSTKQRGVIVYMCTSDEDDVAQLISSVSAIYSSFISRYDYPIAIFHEDYSPSLMSRIQSSAPEAFIYFVQIKFQLPKHLKHLEARGVRSVRHRIPNKEHPTGWHEHEHGLRPYVKRAQKYPYGYQHMCRFFSGAGFLLPFFDSFDWYWRLDSDSICNGQAQWDVFDHLSSCGKEYSHLAPMFGDGGDVVEGLWNAAVNYTMEASVKSQWMFNHPKYRQWGENDLFSVIPSFNTNCELASLSLLRSELVQRFHRFLDEKGGYFLHRWGDAPVRFLGVSMLLPESKTEELHGIQCMHN